MLRRIAIAIAPRMLPTALAHAQRTGRIVYQFCAPGRGARVDLMARVLATSSASRCRSGCSVRKPGVAAGGNRAAPRVAKGRIPTAYTTCSPARAMRRPFTAQTAAYDPNQNFIQCRWDAVSAGACD